MTTTNKTFLSLLVCFGEQTKKISLKIDETIPNVEQQVAQTFDLTENEFSRFQIQFFDRIFGQFVDLDENRQEDLQDLLNFLSSTSKRSQMENFWRLKLVQKTLKRKRPKINDVSTRRSRTKISSYFLALNFQLEDEMRSQYVNDVFPFDKKTQTFRLAGVLMSTKQIETSFSPRKLDEPAAIFRIPDEEIDENWSLQFFIVFESLDDENFYINTWKGIYYHRRGAKIQRSNPENPFVANLNVENVRKRFFLLPLKIANIPAKKRVEAEKTRLLPSIGENSLNDGKFSTDGQIYSALNLNWHRFLLAVLLVHDGRVVERCFSNCSTADPKRLENEKFYFKENNERKQTDVSRQISSV